MPNLGSVTKFFPTPFENSLAMTLNGTIAPGAATVGINNLGNYSNGQVVVFRIDSGTANAQVFTGTVSGSNIINVIWTYGTNVAHTDGAAIVDYASSTTIGMISKGIQVQHNQDGTHGNMTAQGFANTGAFTQTGAISLNGSWDGWVGANESWTFASSTTITVPTDATTKYDVGDYIKITQSATVKYFVVTAVSSTVLTVAGMTPGSLETVANSAISANAYSKARSPHALPAGVSGAWKSWTPTWANLTPGNGVVIASYAQIDKTVIAHIGFTMGSTSAMGTNPNFTLPVAANSRYGTTINEIGPVYIEDSAISAYDGGIVISASTTTASIQVKLASGTYVQRQGMTSTIPFTWGTNDYFKGTIAYEAA